jgi:hypothetical protein
MGAADSDPPIGGLELSAFFLQEDLLLNKKNSHRSGSTGFNFLRHADSYRWPYCDKM